MISPSRLLLLDASGAIVSAILLSVLVGCNEDLFGLPSGIAWILAAIAAGFACFSGFGFSRSAASARWYLKRIALLNALYVLATAVIVVIHCNQIKTIGFIYFVGEMIIVATLAFWEWRTASSLDSRK